MNIPLKPFSGVDFRCLGQKQKGLKGIGIDIPSGQWTTKSCLVCFRQKRGNYRSVFLWCFFLVSINNLLTSIKVTRAVGSLLCTLGLFLKFEPLPLQLLLCLCHCLLHAFVAPVAICVQYITTDWLWEIHRVNTLTWNEWKNDSNKSSWQVLLVCLSV